MTDFAEIAGPLLSQLKDHPDRGPPKVTLATTFPAAGEDFVGELTPLEVGSDFVIADVVGEPATQTSNPPDGFIRRSGSNSLAFYKSFRFIDRLPFRGKWGIFLIDAGIAAVATEFIGQHRALSRDEASNLAVTSLLEHERYHFWIDAWALAQEALPIEVRLKRYEYYLEMRQHLALTDLDVEESLANFHVLRRLQDRQLSDGTRFANLIRGLFRQCPVPYSVFQFGWEEAARKEWWLASAVSNGLNVAMTMMADPNSGVFYIERHVGRIVARSIRPNRHVYPVNDPYLCPVYLFKDKVYASRVQPFQGPDRSEFRKFLTGYLAGSPAKRTDHEFFKIDNGELIKFPNAHDKEIRGYELKNILLKAGMRHPDFVRERTATKEWRKGCPRPEPKPPLNG